MCYAIKSVGITNRDRVGEDPFAALPLDHSSPVVDPCMYKVCIQYDSIGMFKRDKLMQFGGIMHGCVYHPLCDLGVYIMKRTVLLFNNSQSENIVYSDSLRLRESDS